MNDLAKTIGPAALIVYAMGLNVFALSSFLPDPNPLLFVELVIGVASTVGVVGIVARLNGRNWFIARWAYLVIGMAGTLTIFAFVFGEAIVDVVVRTSLLLFLLVGVLVAFAAHLGWGPRPNDE